MNCEERRAQELANGYVNYYTKEGKKKRKAKKIVTRIAIGGAFVAGAVLGIKGYTKLIERSTGNCGVILTNDDLFPGIKVTAKQFGKAIGEYRFVFRDRKYAREFINEFTECLKHCEDVAKGN